MKTYPKQDPIADIYENLAVEQKARVTYEYLLNMIDDPAVCNPYSSYESAK